MSSDVPGEVEERVLLLAPTRKDAQITRSLLVRAGLPCVACGSVGELMREAERGVAAILIAEDAISTKGIEGLVSALETQPPWSDISVIVLIQGGGAAPGRLAALRSLRNVTLLERPAPMRSVLSAVQAAVRARHRQYQIRDQFAAIHQAQQRASHLQEQLEIALEASELGTFHCEIPLNRVDWNDQCKAHFFLPPDAEADMDLFYSIIHPDDRARTRKAVEECVYGGKRYDVEYRTVSPSGQVRWVRATGRTFYNEKQEPVRFDGTTQDVTEERKRAEERDALLKSEQAARLEVERTSRMKDEFLATLSHELRTPLNAILGWSQLLRRDGRTETDRETLDEGLSVIERNARAQTQLIEDLLDMSRIVSGKIRLDVQPVQAASFIDAAIETVTTAAEAKGIRIQKVLDSYAGPVSGDPNRLQQVVWNLLSNAIKFTPRGGRIQVLLERVDSHVEISVADSGQGIRPEFLPYVFERFRQADASTTRSYGGLGLGLAIVKQLVELHGGTIRAKSPGEGQGSTFTVTLPVQVIHRDAGDAIRVHPRTARASSMSADCSSLAGLKVLVVDDEADARTLIRKLLEECDATVVTAGSATEALPLIESERPDVLVSDVGMPETDGYDFLRQVRALGAERGGKVPAIALTAFARSEDRTRALLSGFLVHVSKPVEPQELVATVASVSGRTGETPLV